MNKILHPKYPITIDKFNYLYWELGESMEMIARNLSGWGGELRRHVIKAGLRLKTKREAYDDRMKTALQRKHFFNTEFFDDWSPAMAWILGLIASDGHIHKGGHYWVITLADLDCLEQVADLIEYKGPIIVAPHSKCHILKINSTFMVRKLIELGMTPRKSLTLEYPQMPDDMNCHFIRGYFDGDGSFSTQKPRSERTKLVTGRVTFSTGSINFANSLMALLRKQGMQPYLNIGKRTIRKFPDGHISHCHAAHAVRISSYSVARFYEYIYNNVSQSLCLKRKRTKYLEWYNSYASIYTNGQAPKGHNAIPIIQIPPF